MGNQGHDRQLSGDAAAILDLMERHRSVRSFKPERIPDPVIERAVRAAQCAATSSWIQSYHLLQVEDPEERRRLAELAGGQRQVEESGALFIVCGDARRHELIARERGAPRELSEEVQLLAVVDASLFAQNLALAFEGLGYGVCYIGGLRNDLDGVDRLLELPQGVLPLFGMCVGVPAEPSAPRPRLAPNAVWTKGRYPADQEVLDAVTEFDQRAAAHYAERGLVGRDWSGGIWRKFARTLRPRVGPYLREKLGLEDPRDRNPKVRAPQKRD